MDEKQDIIKQSIAKIGYMYIGQLYADVIPEVWRTFKLTARRNMTQEWSFKESYVPLNGGDEKQLDVDIVSKFEFIHQEVIELQKLCASYGDDWVGLIYELTPNGQFHCDFEYAS